MQISWPAQRRSLPRSSSCIAAAVLLAASGDVLAQPVNTPWGSSGESSAVAAASLAGRYASASTALDVVTIREIDQSIRRTITRSEMKALLPWMDLNTSADGPGALAFTDSGRILYIAVHDAASASDGNPSDAVLRYDVLDDALSVFARLELAGQDTATHGSLVHFKGRLYAGVSGGLRVYRAQVNDVSGPLLFTSNLTPGVMTTGLAVDRTAGTLYASSGSTISRAPVTSANALSWSTVGTLADVRSLTLSPHYGGPANAGLYALTCMVQGIFDDLNPATRSLWKYPDTGRWDPDRNTREFTDAMPEWRRYGLLAFTLNLQGGSPTGYGNQKGWINSGFYPDGRLRKDYFNRLEKILDKADEWHMAVILGLFYFGQDENMKDEEAIKKGVTHTVDWIFSKGYRNVLIEINNECNVNSYNHDILKPGRVDELIRLVKNRRHPSEGYRLYVSTSYGGGHIPHPNVVKEADFLLLHGNGVGDPARIGTMVEETRNVEGYRPVPILFNEDDHFDFDKPVNNMLSALKAGASWGYFDFRKRGETLATPDADFHEGFQSVPVDWRISSSRKKEFFRLLSKISGLNDMPANQ